MSAHWFVTPLARTLGSHTPDWARLADDRPGVPALLGTTLVEQLLRCFGTGHEWLCLQRSGLQAPVEAACILVPHGGGRWSSFMPAQAQLGANLLSPTTDLDALMHALPGRAQQIDLLGLDPQLVDPQRLTCQSHETKAHALTLAIDLGQGYESWWASRSPNLRANLRRYGHRLAHDGVEPCHRRLTAPDDVQAAVQRYAALEAAGWKGEAGTAVREGTAQFDFYRDVMVDLARNGQAQVHELWMGDRLAASRLLLDDGTTVILLKTTHDETLRHYAPGNLLLLEVIRQAFASRAQGTLEFHTNARPDQLAWATAQRHVQHLTAWRSDAVHHLVDLYRRVQRRRSRGSDPAVTVDVLHDLTQWPADVDHFVRRAATRRPWLGRHWQAAVAHMQEARTGQIEYSVQRIDGRVHALWPLHIHDGVARTLSSPLSTDCSIAVDEDAPGHTLAPLFKDLVRRHPDLRTVDLGTFDPAHPLASAMQRDLRHSGLQVRTVPAPSRRTQALGTSWQAYLDGRPASVGARLARISERAREAGIRVDLLTERAQGQSATQALRSADGHGHGAAAGLHQVEHWVQLLARRGWMRACVAWLGQEAIGGQLWFVAGACAYLVSLHGEAGVWAPEIKDLITASVLRHVVEQDRVFHAVDLSVSGQPLPGWIEEVQARERIVATATRRVDSPLHGLPFRMQLSL